MTIEGNRNALLAFHDGEHGTARTADHVAGCDECRAYLQALVEIERALRPVGDEAPPAGLREQVLQRALQSPQRAFVAPAAPASAAPLLALLPVMAVIVAVFDRVAASFARMPYWDVLGAPWAQTAAPFAAAAALLVLAGGLASLAVAPVLVLETRKT